MPRNILSSKTRITQAYKILVMSCNFNGIYDFNKYQGCWFQKSTSFSNPTIQFWNIGNSRFFAFYRCMCYKWPSCDFSMTLRSYWFLIIFAQLSEDHFSISYLLVWHYLMVKQWSNVYNRILFLGIFSYFFRFYDLYMTFLKSATLNFIILLFYVLCLYFKCGI